MKDLNELKGLRRITIIGVLLIAPGGCAGGLAPEPISTTSPICHDTGGSAPLGCITRRNIAALADDPADLHTPRQESPRDAMRRDAVINGYTQSRARSAQSSVASAAQASKGSAE